MRADAKIMCPVEDMGKYSVNPSTIANTMACHNSISPRDDKHRDPIVNKGFEENKRFH